jgi:hypothetical protein
VTTNLEFERSTSGQVEGINDAGVETFAGSHLESLAREQGQNSMDARASGAKGPVDVRYTLLQVPAPELPGSAALQVALKKIREFWSQTGLEDKKAQRAADRALKMLGQKLVPVLRISDRNTTGLRGSDKEMSGDWFSLTKSSGVSLKGEGKLGSFGIGKNVFWANSRLRMVYFSTHDTDDLWAFQGVAKWASHSLDKKTISRAVGFCGAENGFAPIRGKKSIPKIFQPDGNGTDIYVAGFDGGEKWRSRLITAFAENFFVAFHNDLLRVRLEEHEISKANIGSLIETMGQIGRASVNLKNYYDALVLGEAKQFVKDFERLGTVKLKLLVRDGASKSIAMFRATGMLIFEKKHFRTPMQFAGVCICDNQKGNEFLRRLEPPSHNAWEPERNDEDASGASAEIQNLYKWLRDCVNELSPAATAESLDVPELEKFLPDEDEEDEKPASVDAPRGNREGDPSPVELTLEGRTHQDRTDPLAPSSTEEFIEAVGDDDGDTGGSEDGTGEGEEYDGLGEQRKESEDNPGEQGGGEAEEPTPIPVQYRIFRRPGAEPVYLMRAELPSTGKYSLLVAAYGDDGNADLVHPEGATQKLPGGRHNMLVVEPNSRVTGVEMSKAGPATIEVRIPSRVPLSLNARFFLHG